jgi:thiamine biosynthesis lipoprotein
MNRRDFLKPAHLAHSAGQVVAALNADDARAAAAEVALLRLGRGAMATNFELLLPFATPNAITCGTVAFYLLDALEHQLSVYRDGSEVSGLNRHAFERPVAVEERLFTLLEESKRLTAETEGAFDVTSGALIDAWGFFRGPPRVPSESERAQALARVGMQWVALDPADRTVRFLRQGLAINLGSIGKGYALDRQAELLVRSGLGVFLLHGGSSSVYARGSATTDERGWAVGISHPWVPGRRLAQVWLRDRALGTSAATFRHLVHEGRRLGHILDPRTGWPADGLASASVLAPTAAEADALATAFYILGVDWARGYCQAHPDVAAVLLPQSPAGPPVVLGLAPEEIDLDRPPT